MRGRVGMREGVRVREGDIECEGPRHGQGCGCVGVKMTVSISPDMVVRLLKMVSTSAPFMRLGRFLRSCEASGGCVCVCLCMRVSE